MSFGLIVLVWLLASPLAALFAACLIHPEEA